MIPTDDELREMIPVLARIAGLQLSPERVEIVLPEYKNLLERLENLNECELPLEAETDLIFDPARGEV